jgi:hypothetical protein
MVFGDSRSAKDVIESREGMNQPLSSTALDSSIPSVERANTRRALLKCRFFRAVRSDMPNQGLLSMPRGIFAASMLPARVARRLARA